MNNSFERPNTATHPKISDDGLSRPAMLNLQPIGRVWPEVLLFSAKCTPTTEKIR